MRGVYPEHLHLNQAGGGSKLEIIDGWHVPGAWRVEFIGKVGSFSIEIGIVLHLYWLLVFRAHAGALALDR